MDLSGLIRMDIIRVDKSMPALYVRDLRERSGSIEINVPPGVIQE